MWSYCGLCYKDVRLCVSHKVKISLGCLRIECLDKRFCPKRGNHTGEGRHQYRYELYSSSDIVRVVKNYEGSNYVSEWVNLEWHAMFL